MGFGSTIWEMLTQGACAFTPCHPNDLSLSLFPIRFRHPSSRRGRRTYFPIRQCSSTRLSSGTHRMDIHSSLGSDLMSPHLVVLHKRAQDLLSPRGLIGTYVCAPGPRPS